MSLSAAQTPNTFKIEKSKSSSEISDKQIDAIICKLWSQMKKE